MERHLCSDGKCPRCSGEVKSCLHAFRDCCMVKEIWYKLLAPGKRKRFFSLGFDKWTYENLSSEWRRHKSNNWSLIFGMTL